MRITVNLSLFFHDHRCLAKIFINKQMKYIRNVEEHISTIFKIENFYLKCENEYLPPTENVQVLSNDDIVWAIPANEEYGTFNGDNVLCENQEILEERNIVMPKKKKKKKRPHANMKQENFDDENKPKKVKRRNSFNDGMEVEGSEITQEKEKKKKKRSKHIEASEDVSFTNTNPIEERQEVEETSSIPELIQKDSGRDSLNSSKSAETPESNNSSVKCLVNRFEKKKSNFTKQLIESPIEPERKINIVKTIIVSNKNSTSSSSLPNAKEKETCEEKRNDTCKNVYVHVDSLNNEVEANESSSNADTSSVALSNVNEFDTNVNKRRRRRTRKRRSAMQNTSEISTTYEQPVYNFIHKPLIVQTQSPTHVRFSDEKVCPKKENTLPATESVAEKVGEESVAGKIGEKSDEIIIVNESPRRESVKTNETINEDSEDKVVAAYSDKEVEECILKQPVTQNSEPRMGDVLAFKILRISENYTPEVSKSIVGKVMNYKSDTKEITFDIVYGQEQCLPPQGKFSLDHEDQETNEGSQFQCLWPTLLEPRLIYP